MRRTLLPGAVLAVATACPGSSYFVCNDDGDCVAAMAEGVCQPTGACSFADPECDSGQRYADGSQPSLAGECVTASAGTGPVAEGSTSGFDASTTSTSDVTPADVTGDGCPTDWWDCAWAHRQALSLASPVSETLTHVPVLVLLRAGRVDHGRMQADGEDVRFVSASGAVVPFEVERWDPAGVSAIWIGVPELGGAADQLWLYYGNPVAENAEDPAGVWPAPFVGVWHLDGDPLDATPNENHASPNGTTGVVPGYVANGRNLVSTSARLDVGTADSTADLMADGATISAWVRLRSFGGGGFGRIANKESTETGAGWLLYPGTGGRLRFHTWFGPEGNVMWQTPPDALALHRWVHVAVVFHALGPELPRLYVDGLEVELDNPSDVPMVDALPSDADTPLTLGNRPANDRRLDGILDEVRIERAVRSSTWIRVQHDAMRDALLEYGPIESWEVGA
jgi:biopolymer transport protein ExbB